VKPVKPLPQDELREFMWRSVRCQRIRQFDCIRKGDKELVGGIPGGTLDDDSSWRLWAVMQDDANRRGQETRYWVIARSWGLTFAQVGRWGVTVKPSPVPLVLESGEED
jgi:hypothetical protein